MKKRYAILTILFLCLFGFKIMAQDKLIFNKTKLRIGKEVILVEIADTGPKQQQGLMFRDKLDKNSGMLFVFDAEEPRSFWMKNTFIPLSIGFFDSNKKLLEFFDMDPVKSEMQKDIPSYASKRPAKYALEMPKGWFKEKKIKIGSTFSFN